MLTFTSRLEVSSNSSEINNSNSILRFLDVKRVVPLGKALCVLMEDSQVQV
jgi:hypothetical protein